MLRRSVLGVSFLWGAALVKPVELSEVGNQSKSLICKPSELPIYRNNVELVSKCKQQHSGKMFTTIESGVRSVRVEVQKVSNTMSVQKQKAENLFNDAKDKTIFVVDYLNQDDNTFPRYGAIGVGGLSGYIFGLRGGFFRRSLYATIGAGIIASICYPKQAEMYAQHGLVEAKKYAVVGYNFIYGIKPGDDVSGPHFPIIPTNLSELGESLTGLAKSAKNAVFPDNK